MKNKFFFLIAATVMAFLIFTATMAAGHSLSPKTVLDIVYGCIAESDILKIADSAEKAIYRSPKVSELQLQLVKDKLCYYAPQGIEITLVKLIYSFDSVYGAGEVWHIQTPYGPGYSILNKSNDSTHPA